MAGNDLRHRPLSERVEETWLDLPDDTRQSLQKTLGALPDSFKGWRGLIDQAVEHVQQMVGERQAIAIVGPANSGKSTLYNQLLRRGQLRAVVGAIPGTTRVAQEADAGLFTIVDTPGADAVGPVGEEERRRALAAAEQADVLVALFDASHGIRVPERELFADLRALGKPMVVGLNKMDLIARGERAEVLGRAAGGLGLDSEQLLPLSAKEAQGLEGLLHEIVRSEPGILAALAAALPGYRWKLTQAAITRAASTAAAIAVTPLPIVDFIPLIGVQSAMVLTIARIYQYKLTLGRARELLLTFGAGLLGRTLFYELSKFGGPPGWLVAAAVAVGTTTGLGYGVAVWFDRGVKLSRERMAQIGRAFSQTVMDRLRDFGRRRPGRRTLRQRIDEALAETPPPDTDQGG
ncbi:MAG TPA: GTPase [Anaerolineales bacterium]|jgi:GTP-binding protein Era